MQPLRCVLVPMPPVSWGTPLSSTQAAALAPISNSCSHPMHPSSYGPRSLHPSEQKSFNSSFSPSFLRILCLTQTSISPFHKQLSRSPNLHLPKPVATSQSVPVSVSPLQIHNQHSRFLHPISVCPGLLSSAQPFSSPWALVGSLFFSLTLSQ